MGGRSVSPRKKTSGRSYDTQCPSVTKLKVWPGSTQCTKRKSHVAKGDLWHRDHKTRTWRHREDAK